LELHNYILLFLLFLITSAIGVVTGSNSLITVPIMFQMGIDPRIAVATNMFGLTFMSIGGTLPFLRKDLLNRELLPKLVVITLISSGLGALLVLNISSKIMPLIVSVSMISVALFSLLKGDRGIIPPEDAPTATARIAAYVLTFVLGIYGGLFSGGYVTMLTATYVSLLGMTFVQAVSITKVINIFSSFIATILFIYEGIVDLRLGLLIACSMFVGAYAGAKIVLKLNNLWLKRIFLTVVISLGLKIMIYDLLWKEIGGN
jgi:uncharacterized protein